MFSGIVEEKGLIKNISPAAQGWRLTVESSVASRGVKSGDSISVNGVCLTVTAVQKKNISFDVMRETARATNLSGISINEKVNLERALKAGEMISGHYVSGHIDYVGRIRAVEKRPGDYRMDIELPRDKKDYVVEKGSIAVDGVSLTVAEVAKDRLSVYLIPLTLQSTNLGAKSAGDTVNIECDLLGKYALKRAPAKKSGICAGFLRENGFA